MDRQAREGWGAKVIDRLSADLRAAFPDMKGLSSRNLKYMKYFAEVCPDRQFGQQPAAQLPWFHIVTLLTQVRDADERAWYAGQAVALAWSRDTLTNQIRGRLHQRQGAALTNFDRRLPAPQAGLATQILKDPHFFLSACTPHNYTPPAHCFFRPGKPWNSHCNYLYSHDLFER